MYKNFLKVLQTPLNRIHVDFFFTLLIRVMMKIEQNMIIMIRIRIIVIIMIITIIVIIVLNDNNNAISYDNDNDYSKAHTQTLYIHPISYAFLHINNSRQANFLLWLYHRPISKLLHLLPKLHSGTFSVIFSNNTWRRKYISAM